MAKRRNCSGFSIDSLRQEVENEVQQETFSRKIIGDISKIDLHLLDNVSEDVIMFGLLLKFGMAFVSSVAGAMEGLSVLPSDSRRQVFKVLFPNALQDDVDHLFTCLARVSPEKRPVPREGDEVHALSPPSSRCARCGYPLVSHNTPVEAEYFKVTGRSIAAKASLKCTRCGIFYGYSKYGNPRMGWHFYGEERSAVEVSDVCFVDKSLLKWQISFACHSWVSFSGFAVAFNEVHGLNSGLSEKRVANAFWNGELEAELRERKALDMFSMMFVDADREAIMAHIDKLRAQANYSHPPEDCTEDCKARGCGKLWVADGQWKLMFAHCMMKRKNVINGLPLVNYPDVSTAAPVHGMAFCQEHLDFLSSRHPSIPSDIRGFLKHCGVLKDASAVEVADNITLTTDETKKVESVVDSILDTASTPVGQSAVLSQGNEEILSQPTSAALLADCAEETPTSCNKETGEKKRLQKWSRGHFFIVRGSGFIDKWNPLFRSESPSQAFLIIINWLLIVLKALSPSSWGDIYLAYDNMCHVDGMKAASKPLPLPPPFDKMWSGINKLIDSLHLKNHRDPQCKTKYNPAQLKEELPNVNTMAAEQTFVWLSRFKKILCAMPKVHHLFFLHRMVVYRNRYTVSCYKRGLKPVLPRARPPLPV